MPGFPRRPAAWTLLLVLAVAALAGCGGQPAAKPETGTQAAAGEAQAAPAPQPAPEVDKGKVLTEAVVQYFRTIPPTNHQIKAPDLKASLDSGSSPYFLLDIRKPEDYAKGHIQGAVNIPFTTVGDNLDKLPKDKQIVVICYTGQTAGQTVAALRLAGYNAVALHFGMSGWVDTNKFPTVQ